MDASLTVEADVEPHQLNELAAILFDDIRSLALVKVGRDSVEAPESAKSGAGVDIAVLMMTGIFSTATIQAISKIIIAYINRTAARSVKWRSGNTTAVFTGISSNDQRALASVLETISSANQTGEVD